MSTAATPETPQRVSPQHAWQALAAGDFAALEAWLSALLAGQGRQAEAELAVADEQLAAALPENWPQHIQRWREQYPHSALPDIVACLAWDARAMASAGAELEEGQVASESELAQTVSFIHALAAAQYGPLSWLVLRRLMRSAQMLGEPYWLSQWLLNACQHPTAGAAQWPELEALWAQLCEQPLQLPPLPAQLPQAWCKAAQARANRAESADAEEPEGLLWLQLALEQSSYGLQILLVYAMLRSPQWGGSLEEVRALADSPLAKHLDADDRSSIRLLAELEALEEPLLDLEDPEQVAQAITHVQQLLQQHWTPRGRARLQSKLDELVVLQAQLSLAVPIGQSARDSAPEAKQHFEIDQALQWLQQMLDLPEWQDHSVLQMDDAIRGLHDWLQTWPQDAEHGKRIIALLQQYAQRGWLDAMRMLAEHYAAEDRWQPQNLELARQWSEAAERLEQEYPENTTS